MTAGKRIGECGEGAAIRAHKGKHRDIAAAVLMQVQTARCQLTRVTSTRLSENVGARPMFDQASDEIEFTDPSERLSWRQ